MNAPRLAPSLALSAVVAAGLAAFAPLAGCEAEQRVPVTDRFGRDPQIEILDPFLADALVIQEPVTVDRPPAPLVVQVPVRNAAPMTDVYIDYRFVFYDRDDLEIEPAMGWTFKPLAATEQARLEGRAFGDDAVKWTLKIRAAR